LKLKRILKIFVLLTPFLISIIAGLINFTASGTEFELPTDYPLVHVYPEIVSADVGENFTMSVVVYNLTGTSMQDPDNPLARVPLGNFYGFDIEFTWDPTIIEYVSHTVTVPVEDYPDPISPSNYTGILHAPVLSVKEIVNETGRAWFAYTSMLPAEAFNGNGTLFTMTFNVIKEGESPLKIVDVSLSDVNGFSIGETSLGRWLNEPRSGVFRTTGAPVASFNYWPDVGVVGKTTYFVASVTENVTAIEKYMWDFGDGAKLNTTIPTVEHSYTTADTYTVSLKVVDMDGVESGTHTHEVKVEEYRDLATTSITLSTTKMNPNSTLTIDAKVDNIGKANYENCTVIAYYNASYYNASSATWEDTTWIQIGTNQTLIKEGKHAWVSFKLNSSELPVPEAHYYFLVNATGIPYGYERNTEDNTKISDPLWYTEEVIREPVITKLEYGLKLLGALVRPVIRGETTTVEIVVKNDGTTPDTFNVTFYVNGSSTKTWQTSELELGSSETLEWSTTLDAGYYNLTAEARAGTATDVQQGFLDVIEPAKLLVEYDPESPMMNQTVTFDASASVHQDPGGTITDYTWRIYAPEVDPQTGSPTKTLTGPDLTVVSYNFTEEGNWTIVLSVTDNYGIAYDTRRSATNAYRSQFILSVGGGPRGFPIEWIVAIVILAVFVLALVFVLYRRRVRTKELM